MNAGAGNKFLFMDNWKRASEIEQRGADKFKAAYSDDKDSSLKMTIDYIYRVSELKIELANSLDEIDRLKMDIDNLKNQIK